jgi:hypothetical protein
MTVLQFWDSTTHFSMTTAGVSSGEMSGPIYEYIQSSLHLLLCPDK